jgi:hypothetical protein
LKRYERNSKIEKEKKKRKEKNRKRPRGYFSAQTRKRPTAHLLIPKLVPFLSLNLTDAWTPPVSPHHRLPPQSENFTGDHPSRISLPLFNLPLIPAPFASAQRLFNPLPLLASLPLLPLCKTPPGRHNSSPESTSAAAVSSTI